MLLPLIVDVGVGVGGVVVDGEPQQITSTCRRPVRPICHSGLTARHLAVTAVCARAPTLTCEYGAQVGTSSGVHAGVDALPPHRKYYTGLFMNG